MKMNSEKDRENFPGYVPKKKNRLVLVLADFCFAGTSTPVDPEPTKQKAESFVAGIIKVCLENKFEIEGYGTKNQMAARLNKRNGENLFTEKEVLLFANCIAETFIKVPAMTSEKEEEIKKMLGIFKEKLKINGIENE